MNDIIDAAQSATARAAKSLRIAKEDQRNAQGILEELGQQVLSKLNLNCALGNPETVALARRNVGRAIVDAWNVS
jgi:hypothetical protein